MRGIEQPFGPGCRSSTCAILVGVRRKGGPDRRKNISSWQARRWQPALVVWKQIADRLAAVNSANDIAQQARGADDVQLLLGLVWQGGRHGNAVGHVDGVRTIRSEERRRVAGEQTMRRNRNDFASAHATAGLRCANDRAAGADEIVDYDGRALCNVA